MSGILSRFTADKSMGASGLVVPERFRKAVERYAVGLVTRGRYPETYQAPPLLIVEGAPGEGKTRMIREVLVEMGVEEISPLPAASMAGQFEGDSAKPLASEIYRLGNRNKNPGDAPGCLLLDDFDQSIARAVENVTVTSNTGLLNSVLMKYADDPSHIRAIDRAKNVEQLWPIKPVLVVLTVNSTAALYPPLLRAGRAFRFTWAPSEAEKAAMLGGLFTGLDERSRLALAREFNAQPIAFFEAVMMELVQRGVEQAFGQVKREHLFSPSFSTKLNEWVLEVKTSATLDQIASMARSLAPAYRAKDHLQG